MKKRIINITIILLCIILVGCVNLKPIKTPETVTYIIDAVVMPPKAPTQPYSLLITTPKSSSGLTDNHILYIEQPHEIRYFSRSRWIDTPANMLLPLMLQTIQNSGRFQAVVTTPYSGEADLQLDTNLLVLQQEFITRPSVVRLMVRAQLINLNTRRVIATKVFNITQPAEADNPYGGVKATNKAVAKFLIELSQFCVGNTQHIKVTDNLLDNKLARPQKNKHH